MPNSLDQTALQQCFLEARTFNKFTTQEVTDELIERLYDLMKWGPTSMNCQPGHYVIVRSADAKKRLIPALMPGNQDKTMAAPVTMIVATDTQFFKDMSSKFPANPDASEMFESNQELAQITAFRNGTLQGAYLLLAARMLGLDCGPMSGFNNQAVDAEFFPDGRYQSNFLINIGVGDPTGNYPRGTRLDFAQAVEIL
ncbi:MAG: malonic semialdehyde reductase [Gammaproteobacteria bacterium]|nr:malonic semialdehyde reductase [Gammaproteobacteria bacterium]